MHYQYEGNSWGDDKFPSYEIATDTPATREYHAAYLTICQTLISELEQTNDDLEHFYDWFCEIVELEPCDRVQTHHIGLLYENLMEALNKKMPEPISDDGHLPLSL